MSEQYQMKTLDELIEVATPENLNTLLRDLGLWLAIHVGLKDSPVEVGRTFTWNDDDSPGLSEIRVTVQKDKR